MGTRRRGRVVEGARLESVYTVTPYRGFESHRLRHPPPTLVSVIRVVLQAAEVWALFRLNLSLVGMLQPYMNTSIVDVVIDEGDDLWAVRHAIPESLRVSGTVLACDIAIRRGDVMRFRQKARREIAARWSNIVVADFGHIGDGGLHFNMIAANSRIIEPDIAVEIRNYVFDMVVEDFGGSFSAEHGIGPRNQSYYEKYTSPDIRRLSGAVQRLFAPSDFGRVEFG